MRRRWGLFALLCGRQLTRRLFASIKFVGEMVVAVPVAGLVFANDQNNVTQSRALRTHFLGCMWN